MDKNRLRPLQVTAILLSLVAITVAIAGVIFLHQQALSHHMESTRNLAASVVQTIDGMIDDIDYALQTSIDELEHQISEGGPEQNAVNKFLIRQQSRFPHIDLLRGTNEKGETIYGKDVDPAQRASLAERDYFKYLRDTPNAGMVISEPVVGKISQKWIWLMANRVNNPDRSFAGLVYASMFIDDLVKRFEQIPLQADSTISLRDQNMKLVARTAFGGKQAIPVGDARLSDDFRQALETSTDSGSYVSGASSIDGISRIYSYQRSAKYGFTILVGIPTSVAIAEWKRQSMVIGAFLVMFLLGIYLYTRLMSRKWEESILRESLATREEERAFLKNLLHNIPNLVWLKSPDGVFMAANAQFERLVGIPEHEILGRTDFDLVDKELAEYFQRNDHLAIEAGKPMQNEESVVFADDGRHAVLRTTKTPMFASDGTLLGVLGIAHDITESRRQEEALHQALEERSKAELLLQQMNHELEQRVNTQTEHLREANTKLLDTQFAMESVGIGITWIDPKSGRFTYVNRYHAKFLGYSVDEMLELGVSDIDPNFPQEKFVEVVEQIRQQGHVQFETTQRTKDGQIRPVEMTVYYHSGLDQASGRLIAFMSDISRRKEIERAQVLAKEAAEMASKAKSEFLANMSHEIRTPLNAILGLNYLLLKDCKQPDHATKLEKIQASGKHLLSIINDILDLSKIEAGKFEIERGNFHVGQLVDHVGSIIRDTANSRGIELKIDTGDVPEWLNGDVTRLRQALLNFCGNAVKFTDRGSVSIRCRVQDREGDNLRVRIEVVDTGIGLTPEQQARLFQEFQQADNSTSRKYGGTGLGLALTKRLIELMSGTVGVQSEEGLGSTFWLEVPLQCGVPQIISSDDVAQTFAATKSSEANTLQRSRVRVLLAEDNSINAEVVVDILGAMGIEVSIAENGQEAVSKVESEYFDLVLMDMQMPVMNGLDATRQIRLIKGREEIPIIALTANAFAEDRRACLDAGMNDMLTKPLDPNLLFEALQRWLPPLGSENESPQPQQSVSDTPDDAKVVLDKLRSQAGIDPDRCLNTIKGNVTKYIQLMQHFVEAHVHDGEVMLKAIQNGNFPHAEATAHAIKGSASTLGLNRIAEYAGQISNSLRNVTDSPDDPARLVMMASEIQHALIEIGGHLGCQPHFTKTEFNS